jgi:hypothetical protein
MIARHERAIVDLVAEIGRVPIRDYAARIAGRLQKARDELAHRRPLRTGDLHDAVYRLRQRQVGARRPSARPAMTACAACRDQYGGECAGLAREPILRKQESGDT